MRATIRLLLLAVCVCLLSGCGGDDKERGVNRDKDMPRTSDKPAQ